MVNKILFILFINFCCLFSKNKCLNNISISAPIIEKGKSVTDVTSDCSQKKKFLKTTVSYKLKIVLINNSCRRLKNISMSVFYKSPTSKKDLSIVSKNISIDGNVTDTIVFDNIGQDFFTTKDSILVKVERGSGVRTFLFASQSVGLPVKLKFNEEEKLPVFHLEDIVCKSDKFRSQDLRNDTFAICFNLQKLDTLVTCKGQLCFSISSIKGVAIIDSVDNLNLGNNQAYVSHHTFRYIDKRSRFIKLSPKENKLKFKAYIKDPTSGCVMSLQKLNAIKNDTLYGSTQKYLNWK